MLRLYPSPDRMLPSLQLLPAAGAVCGLPSRMVGPLNLPQLKNLREVGYAKNRCFDVDVLINSRKLTLSYRPSS